MYMRRWEVNMQYTIKPAFILCLQRLAYLCTTVTLNLCLSYEIVYIRNSYEKIQIHQSTIMTEY